TAWSLTKQLVGKDKAIEFVTLFHPHDGKYRLPRIEAEAKYRPLNDEIPDSECLGSGTAVTSDEARVKALAEAYERYISGVVRIDKISPATKLDTSWLDPRKIVPLQPFVFERYGLAEFNPDADWQWVSGKRYNSGETVMVPVDLVFYPLSQNQLGRVRCFSSTSSGVAVHTDQGIAIEKALLELIERDAIAVTWYAKRKVSALPVSALPDDVLLRTRHWIRKGWRVKFLDLTLDSVPVVMSIIYSPERYPCFIAGAAASFNWQTAITKAWDEAEIMLFNIRRRKRVKPVQPQDVQSPLDHGNIYFRGENLNQVKWLLDAEEADISAPTIRDASELLRLF
ncbi:MAG: YcaO-like family protein, partial [Rectinemataceae bacterium]|nr:YcaO-like family protein [Rectinemataceae bacterium]